MTTSSLLVELQTEELPPKALKALEAAFADGVVAGLAAADLVDTVPRMRTFATPRRLAVLVDAVADRGRDRAVVEKLMPASIAFDAAGRATDALRKRLDKSGRAALADADADVGRFASGDDRIVVEGDGKGATAFLHTVAAGRSLAAVLEGVVAAAIERLPIPKRMSYQRYDDAGVESTVQFVRPAHHVVALHGASIVPIRILGIDAGRITAGHRFLGRMNLSIADADGYADALRDEGRVLADRTARRIAIERQLADAAGGDTVVMPDALLDEVNALVEWPAVYRGTFDAAFLDVPQECLVLTMQQNQKYFALTDAAGALVNRFLVVSNLATDDPERIVGGNERVLRARLADAKFFYDQDRRTPLDARVEKLKTVVYHNRLGSQYDRVLRVETLAGRIAERLGADVDDARRAARLAKADLVTDMVGEFPELQGLMGRYYATHDGEKPDVAAAIEEQYRPRFAGDALPATTTGVCVALADKLETLVGLFGIGAVPTGDKDPFALRRQALGVIRILIEKALAPTLLDLIGAALDGDAPHDVGRADVVSSLVDFFRVRLAGYLRDLGYSTNEIEAVLGEVGETPLAQIPQRLAAVQAFAALPESTSLASADKRIRNILAKSRDVSDAAQGHAVDAALLTAPAEVALNAALNEVEPRSARAYVEGDFTGALIALASLKEPVDRFFDEVMVNTDDPAVRANRLALLSSLHRPMNRVADLSKLAA